MNREGGTVWTIRQGTRHMGTSATCDAQNIGMIPLVSKQKMRIFAVSY